MAVRGVGMLVALLVLVGVPVSAAQAIPPATVGSFPSYAVGGPANAITGTADFAPPGLADAALTSDAAAVTTASGASAYLGPGTGFGQEFGTTRAQPYLTIRPRTATPAPNPPSTTTPPPSTTTIDFGAAGPAPGWGFALGDIDADWVFVRAYDASGALLPPTALGERATGNYCDSTPKPTTCAGIVAPFDVPNWTGSGSQTVTYGSTAITWAPGTLYGNVADTTGAYAWFTPIAAVHRITLLYGALSGSPVFQLWLTQPAPTTTLSGTVALGSGAPAPSGTAVELQDADGTPVGALDGSPVTAPVGAGGAFSLLTEQRTAYRLQVLAPPGYATPASVLVTPATAATVDVGTLAVDPLPSAPLPPEPSVPIASVPIASEPPTPALAPTGLGTADVTGPLSLAFILLASGVVLLRIGRRRDRRDAVSAARSGGTAR